MPLIGIDRRRIIQTFTLHQMRTIMAADKMTAKDFKAVMPRLKRMTVGSVDIARRVLVDGISQVDAANESGLTKQRVGALVKAVLAAAREIPADWEQVEVWLPPELAAQVRQMATEAKARIDAGT
ncbi:hypothetical protein E2553_37715 [Paraburkholderia dipogonis]|uniref:TrfB transcriptional repressor protein domain-containing protein n=3 Tax=Burkholderiaceae TaxID=119060 RepID=A0A4Y8ML29_9BURK|nr:hypothetical protein E2553_37715 [Paraburkholderia dipogonis]